MLFGVVGPRIFNLGEGADYPTAKGIFGGQ